MRTLRTGWGMVLGGLLAAGLLSGPLPGYATEALAAPAGTQASDNPPRGPAFLQGLNLSPEQMTKLRERSLQNRKEMIKVQAEIQTLQVDLQEELSRESPDQEKVDTITKQLGAAQARLVRMRAERVVFLRSVLTPEQREKLDERLLQLENQGGPWGGHRPRRGGDAPEGGPAEPPE